MDFGCLAKVNRVCHWWGLWRMAGCEKQRGTGTPFRAWKGNAAVATLWSPSACGRHTGHARPAVGLFKGCCWW